MEGLSEKCKLKGVEVKQDNSGKKKKTSECQKNKNRFPTRSRNHIKKRIKKKKKENSDQEQKQTAASNRRHKEGRNKCLLENKKRAIYSGSPKRQHREGQTYFVLVLAGQFEHT